MRIDSIAAELDHREKLTARQVLVMQQMGVAKRRRGRIPRAQYPAHIETDFGKALLNVVAMARSAIDPLLEVLPRLAESAARDTSRMDAGESRQVHELMDAARAKIDAATTRNATAGWLVTIANRTASWERTQFSKQVVAALGVDLWIPERSGRVDSSFVDERRLGLRRDSIPGQVEWFVSENVSLIKSLGNQPLDDVEKLVTRGFANGDRHETLAKAILRRYDVAESSARLIARDQLSKLNAKVTRERHREIGIKRWIWRTAGDEAVRPEHAALDGNEYEYADPPALLPGQDVNCRCYEEPVFDDVLSEIDALEAA